MIGSTLSGRYKIVNVLGAGGMGRTYVAEDMLRPGHPKCVVKQLKPASTDPNVLEIARRLFATEAEILERLGNHDQIPRLLAYFEQEAEFYLVQEFIDGHPFSAELHHGRHWTEAQVVELLKETLSVLTFIHNQNVIHRDIKPDNMIRRSRDNRLVLIDFGAVKQVRLQQLTLIGQASVTVAIGTPGYMPTEQSTGKPRPSSDIYAVGMVGIQALTGVLPTFLPEDEDGEVIWRPLVEVSDAFAEVLNKMVRHYFKHRYQSAAEALQALYQINTASPAAHLPPTQIAAGDYLSPPLPSPPTYPFQPTPLSSQSLTTSQPYEVEPATSQSPFTPPISRTPHPIPHTPNSHSQPVAPTPPPQIPSSPPTQSVSPSMPQLPSVPLNRTAGIASTSALSNGQTPSQTRYQSGLTTPFPGQSHDVQTTSLSLQHQEARSDANPASADKSSTKRLWLGGGIALLLLAGGAVYALFFTREPAPIPVPQLTTPSPSPTPAPSPEPDPDPDSNLAPPEFDLAPAPVPAAAPLPEPTPVPAPTPDAYTPPPAPEPSYAPEPEPTPAPASEPAAAEPPPESSYAEPEPAPESAPDPAPAPESAPEPAPASAPDVPFFEVPDF